MPGISAVIITYNEERNIERCIDSILRVADEIVVVDSFSADRTEELAGKYRLRFVKNKFEGYIQQKNFALSLATMPVVLSLDADESLSPELERSILDIKDDFSFDGYYCNRINNYCGKWIRYTSWYPDRKLRIWHKNKGSWVGLNPHDRVELLKGTRTALLKGNIEHYSFKSVSEHISQVNRFTDISALSYFESGVSAGYHKIIFNPAWKFFREMIVKRGILDGYYGFVISSILSFETFLKYVKIRQLKAKSRKL